MEENLIIDVSESNKGKEQIIINKKYKFKFSYIRKDNSKFNFFWYKNKTLYNKISKEMGLICPEYNSIKSQISRNLNKKLPSNVTTFAEIPSESEYYKTKRGENFMIFKNSNLIIFQFPFQSQLFKENNDDIFVDDKFFIAPKFSYQIFITRTYAKELDSFYNTSFAILKNKEQETYKTLFEKLKKKLIYKLKKNKLCSNEVKNDNNIFIYYKASSNLLYINPEYIFDIYVIIKIKSIKNNYFQFLKFIEYFYKTYLVNYDIKIWNYYNNMEHITNNASESFNNYLHNLFPAKPSLFMN
ncbi:hypothetical protein U3516DRAFT_841665 [Neocallimastix sp. 'constans']